MSYTETSSEGFFSRLSSAFVGIIVGFVLILIGAGLLYWNEGNYVHRAQALSEGKGSVVDIQESKVDAANEGKLVHLTATTKAGAKLSDEMFGVTAQALRLQRGVLIYQWQEKKESKKHKKIGGGEETTTTYTYTKNWSDGPIDSSSFKEGGHDNPPGPGFAGETFNAEDASVGAFKLKPPVLDRLTQYEKLPLKDVELPADKGDLEVTGDIIYKGKNASTPALGDVKVEYKVVKPGTISLVARQVGDSFDNYTTKNGEAILLVENGSKPAKDMFAGAEQSNSTMTWILRLVGWLVMCIGFSMLFGPITIVADIIPFFGDLVGIGTGVFGFLIGTSFALVVIAIGWIVARPLVGILMLAGAIGAIVFAFKIGKSKRG